MTSRAQIPVAIPIPASSAVLKPGFEDEAAAVEEGTEAVEEVTKAAVASIVEKMLGTGIMLVVEEVIEMKDTLIAEDVYNPANTLVDADMLDIDAMLCIEVAAAPG